VDRQSADGTPSEVEWLSLQSGGFLAENKLTLTDESKRRWRTGPYGDQQDHQLAARVTVQSRNLIVVVDDDRSMLESIGRFLEANGFETKLFSSAEAYKAHSEVTDAACLILDIQMPGMSGIDLQRELVRSGHPVPVIFITASDCVATMRSVTQVGRVACLQKPFAAIALLEAVRNAVSSDT